MDKLALCPVAENIIESYFMLKQTLDVHLSVYSEQQLQVKLQENMD